MIEIRIIIEQQENTVVDIGMFNRGDGETKIETKLKDNIESFISKMAVTAIKDGGTVVERRYNQ